jgi:protoporphyrinogen/coproporphyrinogen III oxidase
VPTPTVIIVGAGLSGLCAAYRLTRAGVSVQLIDARHAPGGIVQTRRIQGNIVECGPDSFISQKRWALDFLVEIGLGSQIVGSNDQDRKTWIWKDESLKPLPDGMHLMVPTDPDSLAASELIGESTKQKMLAGFQPMAIKPENAQRRVEDRSVAEFVRQHYGQEAVDYLAEPLLAGVYGGDIDQLSAVSTLPALVELEAEFGGLSYGVRQRLAGKTSGQSVFFTLRHGMQSLIDQLWQHVESHCHFLSGAATLLRKSGDLWQVCGDFGTRQASHLILACGARSAGRLIASLGGEENSAAAAVMAEIPHSSCGTITFGFHPSEVELPRGFGLLVPRKERRYLAACTFVGQKFPHRVADGWTLVRAFLAGEEICIKSENEVQQIARNELQRILNIQAVPQFAQWDAWPQSMPQYTVGHRDRVAQIELTVSQLPQLQIAGNFLHGVGLADAIRSGQNAAASILSKLSVSQTGASH